MKLEAAQSRRPPLPEIVLWIAASRSPSESQTSECSDLLSRPRPIFVIIGQRQPGKLPNVTDHRFNTNMGKHMSRPVPMMNAQQKEHRRSTGIATNIIASPIPKSLAALAAQKLNKSHWMLSEHGNL